MKVNIAQGIWVNRTKLRRILDKLSFGYGILMTCVAVKEMKDEQVK